MTNDRYRPYLPPWRAYCHTCGTLAVTAKPAAVRAARDHSNASPGHLVLVLEGPSGDN